MTDPARMREEHRASLADHLRRGRHRWTRQREAILDLFLETAEHLTSEEIHARVAEVDPSVSLSTVYRTLKLFVDAGIASERRFHDGLTRFEVRQPHHDHLICVRCGKIVEFENDQIEKLQESIAAARGFRLVSHRHDLYGECDDCRTA